MIAWITLLFMPSYRPTLGRGAAQVGLYLTGWAIAYGFLVLDPWRTISWWLD